MADSHAPVKIASNRKKKAVNKPWLSKGILKSIKRKQKLFYDMKNNPNDVDKTRKYKSYSNLLNNIIKRSKKSFLTNKFESYKSNLKKTWKLIGQLVKRKSKSDIFPKHLVTNNGIYTNTRDIANEFNNYFTEIGPTLATILDKTLETKHTFLYVFSVLWLLLPPLPQNNVVSV